MTRPAVAVVIVNWNRRDDTLACLTAVGRLDGPAPAVLVVDNGSSDGSVDAIRSRHPAVEILEMGANRGFTGGSNAGIARARALGAAFILLLNNDAVPAPDCLRRLVEAAAADPAIGIAAPTIYYADRPSVVWSAGGAIDRRRGDTRMVAIDDEDRGQFGAAPRRVDFVSGCALLVKSAVVDRVGALDTRFFAYYEDAEWCVRVTRAGWTVVHVPGARVWHRIAAAARADSPTVHYYMTRNRLLFLEATRADWRAWGYTLVVDDLRTLASWFLRPRWRGKRRQRRAMVRALLDYAGRRFGGAPFAEG